MSLSEILRREKYHTRTVEIETFDYDEQRLVVEGCLIDLRLREYYMATGEKRPPGTLHHMIIRLLVNKKTLCVEDLHVEMPTVPVEDCMEAINSLAPLKGSSIIRGFTSRVKALAGNGKGCSHLVALLTAMGSSTIQGYAAYKHNEPPGNFSAGVIRMLEDTCYTLRSEGALMQIMKKQNEDERERKLTSAG